MKAKGSVPRSRRVGNFPARRAPKPRYRRRIGTDRYEVKCERDVADDAVAAWFMQHVTDRGELDTARI
jgi:hypothetical protein